jgi:hypothetical protein
MQLWGEFQSTYHPAIALSRERGAGREVTWQKAVPHLISALQGESKAGFDGW